MNKSKQSKSEQNAELFVVNGRVYRRNIVSKGNAQKSTPVGTSGSTSESNQSQNVVNEKGCCWAFYLVLYVVVTVVLAVAGAGVAALAWPLVAVLVLFIAGLIVQCFRR